MRTKGVQWPAVKENPKTKVVVQVSSVSAFFTNSRVSVGGGLEGSSKGHEWGLRMFGERKVPDEKVLAGSEKGSFVLNKVLWLGNIQRTTSVKDAQRCLLAENGLLGKVRLNQKCTTGGRLGFSTIFNQQTGHGSLVKAISLLLLVTTSRWGAQRLWRRNGKTRGRLMRDFKSCQTTERCKMCLTSHHLSCFCATPAGMHRLSLNWNWQSTLSSYPHLSNGVGKSPTCIQEPWRPRPAMSQLHRDRNRWAAVATHKDGPNLRRDLSPKWSQIRRVLQVCNHTSAQNKKPLRSWFPELQLGIVVGNSEVSEPAMEDSDVAWTLTYGDSWSMSQGWSLNFANQV